MRKKILMMLVTAFLPPLAIAEGSHSNGHEHGNDHQSGEQASMGHTSMVGGAADPTAASRTITVELLDTMRFAFDSPLDLKRGEVVRFLVTNRGQIRHEFSIGSEAEQESHRAMMRNMPDMVHQDSNTITVEPGETRELVWRFDGEQPVVFACNIPGHAESGMVATTILKP